jgi:hypothetical protein
VSNNELALLTDFNSNSLEYKQIIRTKNLKNASMSRKHMNYKALHNKIFEVIFLQSQELNIDSYVIGGFVRDLILKEILKDIDIVAVGSGINWH